MFFGNIDCSEEVLVSRWSGFRRKGEQAAIAQIFRASANTTGRLGLSALVLAPLLILALLIGLRWTDYATGEDQTIIQNIPFSHAHHAAEVGIDCRYCHTSVETSARAGIPPTSTCMTCHSRLWSEEEMLEPVRTSFATNRRLSWNPVNDLPDYVYFNHSVHVSNNIACTTCHGEVGEMKLMRQAEPLTMGWCLDCHRAPVARLSPRSAVFSPFRSTREPDRAEIDAFLSHREIAGNDLTDCSTCHR
jgi:hypothetical protein